MAEAIGVVGSIITLLQLSAKVVEYLSAWKDASEDRQRLLTEICSTTGLLYVLKEQSEKAETERLGTIASLGAPGGPIEQFHQALEELVPRLLPAKGLKKVGKVLTWPFKKEEILAILRRIERQKSLFSLALQNDHIGLSQAIRGDVADLSQGVKEIRIAQKDDAKDKVLQWLSSANPSSNHEAARKKHEPATGAWLLRSQSFNEWKENANTFLWLHGILGCGKTILCSTVIENIASVYPKGFAYYYFDFNDRAKQNDTSFVRSVIAQLSRGAETLPDSVRNMYNDFHRTRVEPSLETLFETLMSVIQGHDPCFLIFDALDESERKDILAILSRIASRGLKNLRMLVTSRMERDIENTLAPIVTSKLSLSLDSTNVDADIGLYVRQCLVTDPKLKRWSDPVKQEIESSLTKGAHGMFRWAECQITALRLCKTEGLLRKALRQLPKTLDETYDRILLNIPEEDRKMARSALLWLAFSERPLYLDEVAEAAILSPESCTLDPEDRLYDSHDIIDICSGLVTSVSIEKYVSGKATNRELLRFAHFSVKEYLTSDRIAKGDASAFAILELEAQSFLAEVCISYLLLFNNHELSSLEEVYARPLLEYAAEFWHVHASSKVTLPAITVSQMHTLFRPHKGASFLNWLRICEPDFGRYSSTLWYRRLTMNRTLDVFTSPLWYASLLGNLEVVSSLIVEGADVNADCGTFGYPLRAAAFRGHTSVVQLLLSEGADIKAENRNFDTGTALDVAAMQGHESVVQLLMSKEPDTEADIKRINQGLAAAAAQDDKRMMQILLTQKKDTEADIQRVNEALVVAAAQGHESVVQLLLSFGVNVNPVKDQGKIDSPLHAAAQGGHESIVQLLLKAGANVNAQGGEYGSSLQAAAARGYESVVQLLLKAGADVNAQGGRYGSALQAAAAEGAEAVVQLLLKAGADVNAQDEKYGSALQAAAERRHKSVLLLLLRAGAEVPPGLEDTPEVQKALAILKQEATKSKDP